MGTSTQTNHTKGRNSLPAGLTSPSMPAEHSAIILTTMQVVDNTATTWLGCLPSPRLPKGPGLLLAGGMHGLH